MTKQVKTHWKRTQSVSICGRKGKRVSFTADLAMVTCASCRDGIVFYPTEKWFVMNGAIHESNTVEKGANDEHAD